MLAFMRQELSRVQRHAILLAMTATQRVADFLLDMSSRLAQPDALELPMTRQDIADYLGLTIETVSRAISRLKALGLIETRQMGQVIVLHDLPGLHHLCERSPVAGPRKRGLRPTISRPRYELKLKPPAVKFTKHLPRFERCPQHPPATNP